MAGSIGEGRTLRITENRYDRDRLKLDLARRMIRYEARTCTIRACTGLSEDRIRKLFRSYDQLAGSPIRRRRGKPPGQVAFFTRSAAVQLDASLLASILFTNGLLSGLPQALEPGPASIELVQLFCDAYETYANVCPDSLLSFEHAWFLLNALLATRELRLVQCGRCDASYVRDQLTLDRHRCPACRLKLARLRAGELRAPADAGGHGC